MAGEPEERLVEGFERGARVSVGMGDSVVVAKSCIFKN